MSDTTNLVDLRQATLSHLVEAMRQLGEHVMAMNTRYIRLEQEVTHLGTGLRAEMARGFADTNDRIARLSDKVGDLHSEVILQSNQILNAQQRAMQNALRLDDLQGRPAP